MKKIIFLLAAAGLFLAVAGSAALAEQIVCQGSYSNCDAACSAAGGSCFDRSCSWSNSCPSGSVNVWCVAAFGVSLCGDDGTPSAFCKCTSPLCVPATCASLGKNCGSWSDGCGGTLNCGGCGTTTNTCSSYCSGGAQLCAYSPQTCSIPCNSGTCGSCAPPCGPASCSYSMSCDQQPSVSLTVSPNPAKAGQTVTFTATATDDYNLNQIAIYVNPPSFGSPTLKKLCSVSGTSASCDYSQTFDTGTNTSFAWAKDSAGHGVSTSLITLTIEDPFWTVTEDLSVCDRSGDPLYDCLMPLDCSIGIRKDRCRYTARAAGTACTGGKCYAGTCDPNPPTTSISWIPPNPDGNNGWYKTTAAGTITCNDVGSSCKTIKFTTNGGGSWTDVSASSTPFSHVVFFGDSAGYSVQAYSFDYARNEGGRTPSYSIKVDTTPPSSVSVIGQPGGWVPPGGAAASLACSDSLSGCDPSTYRLKVYSSNPGACSSDYSEYGIVSPQTIMSHLWVCGAAKDMAGNAGFTASPVEFLVDGNPPQVKPYGIPFAPCDTDPNLQPDPDPAVRWIDCSATASFAASGSKGCIDGESGCNPASYKFITFYPDPPYACPRSPSYYSSIQPQIGNATWVCGYAEDNMGNFEFSAPTRFLVNRTFEVTVNARVSPVVSTPGIADIPAGTEVRVYLCKPSEYFCNQDAKYLASGANFSDADRNFVVSLWYDPLIRGQEYKVGIVTDKGYSESVFIA